jgi:hypothetical protein
MRDAQVHQVRVRHAPRAAAGGAALGAVFCQLETVAAQGFHGHARRANRGGAWAGWINRNKSAMMFQSDEKCRQRKDLRKPGGFRKGCVANEFLSNPAIECANFDGGKGPAPPALFGGARDPTLARSAPGVGAIGRRPTHRGLRCRRKF